MVKWYDTIIYMKRNGIKKFYEVGFGKTLSGIIKRIDRELKVSNIDEPLDLETLAKELQ